MEDKIKAIEEKLENLEYEVESATNTVGALYRQQSEGKRLVILFCCGVILGAVFQIIKRWF